MGLMASTGSPYLCATVGCFKAAPVRLDVDGNITQAINCTVLCSHRLYLMLVK